MQIQSSAIALVVALATLSGCKTEATPEAEPIDAVEIAAAPPVTQTTTTSVVVASSTGENWIYGTDADDELAGGDGADVILGGPGDDAITGGDGNDLLVGDDAVINGAGSPVVTFGVGTLAVGVGQTASLSVTVDDDGALLGAPSVNCTAGEYEDGQFIAPHGTQDSQVTCTATAIDMSANIGAVDIVIDVDSPIDIDTANLLNYANQAVPAYITKDNTVGNPITDAGATLGRVLFYDVALSSDNTVSCASCHQQAHAFSDTAVVSQGVNGLTRRHSTRLVNARFGDEDSFRWDETAATLEDQVTGPIRDHGEMGFSGENGAPDFDDLLVKLAAAGYYKPLFAATFGDETITEDRIQRALAQFVRSIQSFDSRYDTGRAQANNNNQNFANFTDDENAGKTLFTQNGTFVADTITVQDDQGADVNITVSRRTGGGFGCNGCHRAPEFDIAPNSRNIGLTDLPNSDDVDTSVTRSPALRDVVTSDGTLNGGMFHVGLGEGNDLGPVLDHYNLITADATNNNLDNRLTPDGLPQFLDMTDTERAQVIAFLQTLSGTDVYTNEKWSDPFAAAE